MAIDLASVLGTCKLAYDNICNDNWQRLIVNHHSVHSHVKASAWD